MLHRRKIFGLLVTVYVILSKCHPAEHLASGTGKVSVRTRTFIRYHLGRRTLKGNEGDWAFSKSIV
jgi:hypothetical protein